MDGGAAAVEVINDQEGMVQRLKTRPQRLPYQPDTGGTSLAGIARVQIIPEGPDDGGVLFYLRRAPTELVEDADQEVFNERGLVRENVIRDENTGHGVSRAPVNLAQPPQREGGQGGLFGRRRISA